MKEIYQLNFLGGRLRLHTCPVNRLSTAVISCCSCVKFLGLGNVHEQPVQEKQSFSIDMSPLEPGLICQTKMRSFLGASPGMNWRCLHRLLGNRNKFLARGGLGVFQEPCASVFLRYPRSILVVSMNRFEEKTYGRLPFLIVERTLP